MNGSCDIACACNRFPPFVFRRKGRLPLPSAEDDASQRDDSSEENSLALPDGSHAQAQNGRVADAYIKHCAALAVHPDQGVVACLRLGTPTLVPHERKRFGPGGMLAMLEASRACLAGADGDAADAGASTKELLDRPGIRRRGAPSETGSAQRMGRTPLGFLRHLGLNRCDLGSNGATVLAALLREGHLSGVESLSLDGCHLEFLGSAALAPVLFSGSLRCVSLRGCAIGNHGAMALAEALAGADAACRLRRLDVSCCGLDDQGIEALKWAAAAAGNDGKGPCIELIWEGNNDLAEVLNALSHGLGLLLALLGSPALIRRASAAASPADGSRGVLAATMYCCSLCLLYFSSTAYHTGFRLTAKYRVLLQVMDHSAIFALIAGTYTPFLLIVVRSVLATAVMWTAAIAGIGLSIVGNKKSALYNIMMLALFLCMGWSAVPFAPLILNSLPPPGVGLLVGGGIAYTAGVPFFRMGNRRLLWHALWHVFVLAGSALHFACVFFYVYRRYDGPGGGPDAPPNWAAASAGAIDGSLAPPASPYARQRLP